MHATENKSWIDQLEVTGPIKGIMAFIDELANTYDKRVAAMHADYQRDVEEILACYKKERQDFHDLLEQQKNTIVELQTELKTIQQSYKTLNIEYNLAKDSLETSKEELIALTKTLKTEQELIELTNQRITSIRQQLALADSLPEETIITAAAEYFVADQDLGIDQERIIESSIVLPGKRPRFSRARDFFRQVIADRLTRPIILKHKEQIPITVAPAEEDQDTFSY